MVPMVGLGRSISALQFMNCLFYRLIKLNPGFSIHTHSISFGVRHRGGLRGKNEKAKLPN